MSPNFRYFFFVPFFLISSQLLHFLNFFGYPLLSLEVLISFLFIALLSLVISGMAKIWRGLGVVAIGYVVVNFLFDALDIPYIETLRSVPFLSVFWRGFLETLGNSFFLIFFCLACIWLYWLGNKGWQGLTVAAVTISIVTVLTGAFVDSYPKITEADDQDTPVREDLAPWIHIIFDEHMGTAWIPETGPNAMALRKEIKSFYSENGFLLFSKAYSHYLMTGDSLSNAFSFQASKTSVGMVPKHKVRIKDNKVLENLKERGYRTRVYNFQGLDLCNGDAASADYCYKYHYNDIRLIANTKVSLIDKIFLIFGHFMKPTPTTNSTQIFPIVVIKAILASFMGDRISQVPIFGSSDYDRVSPLSGMEAFEALMADVERYPRGTAFIAHILFPHYPYMYDSSCNMVKDPHKWLNVNIFKHMNGNDPMQEERKQRYYQQTLCLYSMLSKWFSKLRTTGALSGATVIMHGDHGSRICDAYPRAISVGNPRWNQITKNCFSILFGIKAPNVSPGLSNSIKPLEQLLYQSYITPENLMSPATDDPYLLIYNETPKWPATFIRQPLEGWD